VRTPFNQRGPGVAYSLLVLAVVGQAVAFQPGRQDLRGVEAAERLVREGREGGQTGGDRAARPAALVDGRPVNWDELQPALAEAAGGIVLQEAILDRALERLARVRGITIGPEAIERERALLLNAIVREARTEEGDAEQLLLVVRRSRGLGETRFARLLERNARLRALAAAEVEVEREEIDREFLLRHGPRYRVRVIMAATHRQAAEARQRIGEQEEGRTLRFAEVAASVSLDPSAERGGIVDPISPADPTYPASIREALERLAPGEISAVLAIDRGFALLLMEERIPGDGVEYADVEAQISADVRRAAERMAMDDLARRLLREASVSIMDKGLEWSWRAGER
jgi:parvulin-like peptidyl-prolyl isomerase